MLFFLGKQNQIYYLYRKETRPYIVQTFTEYIQSEKFGSCRLLLSEKCYLSKRACIQVFPGQTRRQPRKTQTSPLFLSKTKKEVLFERINE